MKAQLVKNKILDINILLLFTQYDNTIKAARKINLKKYFKKWTLLF